MGRASVHKIIIWSVIAAALCLLLCVGLWIHGRRYMNSRTTADGTNGTGTISSQQSFDGQTITKVKVEWVAGMVNVRPGKLGYQVDEPVGLSENKLTVYEIQGNTLIIKEYAQDWDFSLGINLQTITNYPSKELQLYIPSELMELEIETVSADVTLENGVEVQSLDIDAVSADIGAAGLWAGKIKIESVSGMTELSIEDNGKLPDKISVNSVSGDVVLLIPDSMGYELEMESVSGDQNIRNMSVTNRGDKVIYGDGGTEIEVETVSGDLIIDLR